MGVLDNAGLAHFWGKVKDALSGKQDTITAGDGLSKEGDTLSVTTPTRGVVTQAEFDALPEERRNSGLYVISDGGEGGGGSGSAEEVYSTEETRIGTWIDGKPLYRKVIQFAYHASTAHLINIEDLNVDFLVKIDGWFLTAPGDSAFPLQWYLSPTSYAYVHKVSKSRLQANLVNGNYRNQPGIMILEYTKTTDEGGAE